jgi:hypothetical protein
MTQIFRERDRGWGSTPEAGGLHRITEVKENNNGINSARRDIISCEELVKSINASVEAANKYARKLLVRRK